MADLSITAASVLASANCAPTRGINYGATITQGQVVYYDSTTATWKLADANGSSTGNAANSRLGIALVSGANQQPGVVAERDSYFTPGATLTNGASYWVSSTAGGICPVADVASGNVAQFLGVAKSTTILHLNPTPSGCTV